MGVAAPMEQSFVCRYHRSLRLRKFVRRMVYYENERYIVFRGFSARNLLPVDVRGRYSDSDDHSINPADLDVLPNSRWHWVTRWAVDLSLGDEEGWQYAANWPQGLLPGATWADQQTATSFVRHRRWRR